MEKSDFVSEIRFLGRTFPSFLEYFSEFSSEFVWSIFPNVEYFSGFFYPTED